MRVATFNVQHGQPNGLAGANVAHSPQAVLDRLAGEIRALNIDVLALQEIDKDRRSSGHIDQPAYLACTLGMNHVYAPSAFGYGVATLSRYPIIRSRYLRLPQPAKPIYRDTSGGLFGWKVRWPEPRVALYCEFMSPVGPTSIANTHLDIHNMTARHQLQVVVECFERRGVAGSDGTVEPALLIAGDLNLYPDAVAQALGHEPMSEKAIARARATGWTSPIPQAIDVAREFEILHRQATYPSAGPAKQIDFVLGSLRSGTSETDELHVQGEVHTLSVSDHALLVVDIEV